MLEVFTTQPGMQFYTANYLNNVQGKDDAIYNKHSGFCLETQNYPNAINQVLQIYYHDNKNFQDHLMANIRIIQF